MPEEGAMRFWGKRKPRRMKTYEEMLKELKEVVEREAHVKRRKKKR